MKSLFSSVLLAFLTVRGAAAWGNLGHETVGYVAQQFLAPKALSFVKSSLGAQYNESLGPAATWADEVKSEAAFSWSSALHFVDAEDDPLHGSCSVSETRDCSNGRCILTAIANYTTRVQMTSLSAEQRQEALKFIDHFLGDIGQPLHVEALEAGGNDISAKCSGESSTNLHAVWDTGILTKHIDTSFNSNVQTYANSLVTRLKTGDFSKQAASFISCSSITEPASSKRELKDEIMELIIGRADNAITPLACPLVWAADANAFDCSFVFNFSTGEDLCSGTYFSGAIPIIDLQLAKQGFRLAAWLNVIFDGATMLP
ncbi:nuclease Le1 [Punctularia strigosozonata HHB-11173 SS5]|uniref:nuclease Le1 n=1 Tax=Punctularia strigosozonata (strain HHB-11173) TaxID=741275 RepID=UPI0004416E83|nr:nuclease Le1 [Punctularia strigosozonata HHB-11173 SS5]EIN05642.1 nuclease Le1 [Punctularia strigosozonata HHB-11173 SS5]